jgi:alpha/beta superfamily hydrolase
MRFLAPAVLAAAALSGLVLPATFAGAAGGAERPVMFASAGAPGVALQGMLAVPGGNGAAPGVVICHPNPLAGGSMDNEIIEAVGEAFSGAGFATRRFNLRGVGRSTGTFAAGTGEVNDVLGALEFLRRQAGVNRARVSVVGYSFGARVGLEAAVRDGKVPACPCLGFPARGEDDVPRSAYFKGLTFPTVFVAGTEDAVCKLGVLESIVRAYGVERVCRLEPIQGADHFFTGVSQRGIAVRRIVQFVSRVGAR